MEFKKQILSNGLSVIGEINNSAKSAAVGFFVKTGSRDECKEINGVSHFLEHMLFKGTEKLSALQVNEAFDKTGAQFNAFTSEEMTVFYAAVLPEYLIQVTQLWAEIMKPSLRIEDFDIEKNVIKEEIAMYKDMPNFDVIDRCRKLHFDSHPCGNSVLGTDESITNLTALQMRGYFANRYAPNNMTVAVAGNFQWDKFISTIDADCSKWKTQDAPRIIQDHSGNKKIERIEKANLSREHICLMSPAVSAQDPGRFASSVLAAIIGDSVGSQFFWELVDKALAEIALMQFVAMDGTGLFCSYISCSSENTPKVLDIVKNVFDNLKSSGVTEKELQTAKNKILSALVIKNELPMGRLADLGFNWLYLKQYRHIDDDINSIKSVNQKDIHNLIEQYDSGEFTQLSLGPKK